MKLTVGQMYHTGWCLARDAEDEICAMAEAGHTKREILIQFPDLSTRALIECLRQNGVVGTGSLARGARGKDKKKRAHRRSKTQMRADGDICASDKRFDTVMAERYLAECKEDGFC